jgi:hypothetical protein
MGGLRRFWLRFAISPGELGQYPSYAGLGLGCGVTAYSLDDAKAVLRQELFRDDPLPEIEEVVEDVDVQTLDQGRVVPNMGPPNERGVWFPWL